MSSPAKKTQPSGNACAYEGCSESAWSESPDGLCLYHAPQNEKDQDTAREVWQCARRKAAAPDGCSFAGWHFPRDPDGQRFDGCGQLQEKLMLLYHLLPNKLHQYNLYLLKNELHNL